MGVGEEPSDQERSTRGTFFMNGTLTGPGCGRTTYFFYKILELYCSTVEWAHYCIKKIGLEGVLFRFYLVAVLATYIVRVAVVGSEKYPIRATVVIVCSKLIEK